MAGLIKTSTKGVYKAFRSQGTVYVARWREVDPDTGKARVRDKTFRTLAEARQYRAEVSHAQAKGTYAPPNAGKVTLSEVAEQWLAGQKTRVRPRTRENYERALRLRVLPAFGHYRVDKITSMEVEKWQGAAEPGTLAHARFAFSATLRYACKHGLIQSNPFEKVDPPKSPADSEKFEGHFLSRAEVAALAAKVGETDPVWGLLVRFAAGVGLRASEIAGLRICDVNLSGPSVTVERAAERRYPGGEWAISEPKSRKSRRKVPILDGKLLDDLRTHLARHPRRDELNAPFWPGRGRSGPDYGSRGADRLWEPKAFYRNVYRPAVAAVGLPADPHTGVRFHDLRHTCGSQWLADGHEMFDVSTWLGHGSIDFTYKVYSHVAKDPDYARHIEITRKALGL